MFRKSLYKTGDFKKGSCRIKQFRFTLEREKQETGDENAKGPFGEQAGRNPGESQGVEAWYKGRRVNTKADGKVASGHLPRI